MARNTLRKDGKLIPTPKLRRIKRTIIERKNEKAKNNQERTY
jgi:hypothetical protein